MQLPISKPLNNETQSPLLSPGVSTVKKIGWVIGFILVLVAVSVALVNGFQQLVAADKSRSHMWQSLGSAAQLASSLSRSDSEATRYGFTGDNSALTQYQTGRAVHSQQMNRLRDGAINDEAKARAERVFTLVNQHLAGLAEIVALRQNAQPEVLPTRVSTGEDRRQLDAAQREIQDYIQFANAELALAEALYQHKLMTLVATLVGGSLVVLLCGYLLASGFYRSIRLRLADLIPQKTHLETLRQLEQQECLIHQLSATKVALEQEGKKLLATVDSIADAVVATDDGGRVRLLNRRAECLTGWTQDQALNCPLEDVLTLQPEENGANSTQLLIARLLSGEPYAAHAGVLVGADGNLRNVAISGAASRDDTAVVEGAVFVIRDTTQEFAAQLALQDSTALLQTILSTVADGVVTFNASTRLIATANCSAEKMFGYVSDEFIDLQLDVMFPEAIVNEGSLEFFNGTAEDLARGIICETVARHKSGEVFPVEIQASEMVLGNQRYFTCVIRNIAARKNAEAEVQASEFRYRNLFNTIDEGFATLELIYQNNKVVDYRFLEVNASFAKQTGLENVTGKTALETMPDLDPVWFDILGGATATGEAIRFVHNIPSLNRWFDVYACADTIQKSKNVILLLTDITERIDNERALRGTEERMRLATEATGVGIWEWNLVNQTLHWDAQMFRIYGVNPTADGMVNADIWAEFLSSEDLPAAQLEYCKTFSSKKNLREFRVKRSGEQGVRNVRSVEIFRCNTAGDIESIIGTHLDITDIKKTEATLRESEGHLRAVINALPVAIYTTNADGLVTHFNQAAVDFSGRIPEIGSDKWCVSLKLLRSDGSLLPHDQCPMAMALTTGRQILGAEAIAELPDGTRRWFNAYPTPLLDGNGEIKGGINMLVDVTERKALDKVLLENNIELKKAKNLAEKANLAKSDFLSNMSHELRTPLSAILGFAQLIEASNPAPTSSLKRSVDQILRAGWYLLDLINEILDLALIESGKLSLVLEAVSVTELLYECEAMVEPQACKRSITIELPPADKLCMVNADKTRLKQVIFNLFSNAIKYNRPNGKIIVSCVEHIPRWMRIAVTDTGEGIPAENIEHLFQPFNRLGKENGAEEGTGIGLVMTKRLIELMGGEIGVDSCVGRGSTFYVDLETASEFSRSDQYIENPTETTLLEVRQGGKRTLLYVEDNVANLALVADIVAPRADIALLSAPNGDEGIALARSAQPDLILMDINLPGINGIEVLKILAKDPLTADIPVIALSANALPRDIEKGLKAGFFRYLTKPIKIKEFMQVVDLALEHGAQTSSRFAVKESL